MVVEKGGYLSHFSFLKSDSPSSTGLLSLLNVRSFQIAVLVMSFYITLSYPVAVYCQNTKRNLKILRRAPC